MSILTFLQSQLHLLQLGSAENVADSFWLLAQRHLQILKKQETKVDGPTKVHSKINA